MRWLLSLLQEVMGASPGRTLWSLDFWPKRQTDSVCPGESICLQVGHSGHNIYPPSPDVPLKGPSHDIALGHIPQGTLGFTSICT